MSSFKVEKVVTLKPFKPEQYLIWKAQAEATFRVHGLLGIVTGEETRPARQSAATPATTQSSDGGSGEANDPPFDPTLGLRIVEFEKRHGLAIQALINCLDGPEAIKVYNLDNANAIWKRLGEEYGQVSSLRRSTALQELYTLRKEPSKTMAQHIETFSNLQTLADYHRPPENKPMSSEDTNTIFMTSLGEEYKVYRQAMGIRAHSMSTAQLYAEFRALEMVDANNASNTQQDRAFNIRSGPVPGRTKPKYRNGKPIGGKSFKRGGKFSKKMAKMAPGHEGLQEVRVLWKGRTHERSVL